MICIYNNPNDRQDLLDLLQGEVADDVPYLWAYQQTEFRTWGTWLHGDGLIYNPMHDIYFYHVYKMNSPDPYSETTPQISHPDDIEMVVGTTGLNVTWIATDFFRDTFEISKDGVIIDSGDWTSYELNASLDGLTLGVHNFTLMVTNLGGNSASDSVIVTVVSDFNLTQTLVLVISIGSLGVIVVVIVLFVKRKRG